MFTFENLRKLIKDLLPTIRLKRQMLGNAKDFHAVVAKKLCEYETDDKIDDIFRQLLLLKIVTLAHKKNELTDRGGSATTEENLFYSVGLHSILDELTNSQ